MCIKLWNKNYLNKINDINEQMNRLKNKLDEEEIRKLDLETKLKLSHDNYNCEHKVNEDTYMLLQNMRKKRERLLSILGEIEKDIKNKEDILYKDLENIDNVRIEDIINKKDLIDTKHNIRILCDKIFEVKIKINEIIDETKNMNNPDIINAISKLNLLLKHDNK